MGKDPVFYALGVPGQFYLARAVSKEFNRPVVGLVLRARMEEKITPEIRNIFYDILSLPDFYLKNKKRYEAMGREELDALQKNLEKTLHIANAALYASHDRALRWCGDYEKARYWMIACMEFAIDAFEKYKPVFCIDGVAHFFQLVMRSVCAQQDIPYLLTQNSRLNGHFNIMHDNGQHVGFMETFRELEKGHTDFVAAEEVEAADRAFYQFINKPQRPAYAAKNSVVGLNIKKLFKKLSYTLHPERLNPSQKVRDVDRFLTYEANPFRSLMRGVVGRWRRLDIAVSRIMENDPDLEAPYIYLPLHYAPEVSDMYFGTAYDHHAGFVTQLAKHIPSHMQIYVKEHTSMLGRRPVSFYRELSTLYNVKIIGPAVDTFALSYKSSIVATVTGTAGWEAYLMGKPVIALGNVFYNGLPGIYHAPLDRDFKAGLDRFLQKEPAHEKTRLNAYRAFYITCSKGSKGDIGPDITFEEADVNAALFAQGIAECIRKWGDTMKGSFPDDMLSARAYRKKTA